MLNLKNKNIVFIGFMGVGKGTIARALIKRTKRFGLDTDDLIESMENRKIKAIFETDGEAYFRKLEKKKQPSGLKKMLKMPSSRRVVAFLKLKISIVLAPLFI